MRDDDRWERVQVGLAASGWFISQAAALDMARRYAQFTGRRQRVGRNSVGLWLMEDATKSRQP